MHTLDEVMGKAPALDEANGATAADVASGKTFWGLKERGGLGPDYGDRNPENRCLGRRRV